MQRLTTSIPARGTRVGQRAAPDVPARSHDPDLRMSLHQSKPPIHQRLRFLPVPRLNDDRNRLRWQTQDHCSQVTLSSLVQLVKRIRGDEQVRFISIEGRQG